MSLREGGTHEEEALLEELKKIVSSVDGLQEEVGGLLVVMVPFGYTKEASAVQRDFSELLEYIKCKSETVWVVPPVVNIADSANIQVRTERSLTLRMNVAPATPLFLQGRLGPAATVNSIMAAMATPMQQHPAGSSGKVYSGTSYKGHNKNNLRTKDKVQCTKWRLSYSFSIIILNRQKTMGPKRVRYSEVPLYYDYDHTLVPFL